MASGFFIFPTSCLGVSVASVVMSLNHITKVQNIYDIRKQNQDYFFNNSR